MKVPLSAVLLATAAIALAGCGGEKKASTGQASGGGQILDRSVTDEMPPYDTARSQPPLAAPDASDGAYDADAMFSATTRGSPAAAASGAADDTAEVRPDAE